MTDWPPPGIDWYYSDSASCVALGDSRTILPLLPNVDCVVTDPPWKATQNGFCHRRPGDGFGVAPVIVRQAGLKYGDIGTFEPELVRMAASKAESDILIMCGYIELGEVIQSVGKLRGVFVWYNPRAFPIPGPVAMRDVSFIVWGGIKTTVDQKRARWKSSLFECKGLQGGCMATERIQELDGSTSHPAQEPINLMFDLIAPLAGVIMDPWCGTGTTLRAAKDLGRKSIGIEINEKYAEIAARRLAQEVLPFRIPTPQPAALTPELNLGG